MIRLSRDVAIGLTNPNVSVQTVKAVAGHVSQCMVDRYAISASPPNKALWKGFPARIMAQLTTQKAAPLSRLLCNLLILLVGAWGFEPQTPTVSKIARRPRIPLIRFLRRKS
jgi:signal recognition particle GTPase